jgi:glycine betaine/choline ABC-type transport system substrate-binding protein
MGLAANLMRRRGLGAVLVLAMTVACGGEAPIVVGSKNFTESIILGEIVAQRLEQAGRRVDRRFNLGGTFICHEAITRGQIDVYVEYGGTAYAAVLERPIVHDPETVRREVERAYREQWDLVWGPPLGFDNTFAILVRGADARALELQTLSDAVPHARAWRPGFGYEFADRADGLPGLVERYGFAFGDRPAVMDLGLTYRALADGEVDVIAGNATDGQIDALDLVHLRDDLGYFPPYEAAPVVRAPVWEIPVVREVLENLGGIIDDATMRRLNRAVDVDRQDIPAVVRAFLAEPAGAP